MATQQQSRGTTIWQWNCRGFRNKRGALAHFIASRDSPPEVLALQETGKDLPILSGYQTITHSRENPRIATLIQNHITAKQHEFDQTPVEHVIVEILPTRKNTPRFFILNLYSPPSHKKEVFNRLFARALNLASQNLLIVGDFNAPHAAWGYEQATTKGTKLYEAICQHQLTVLTDPEHPTRTGNSVTRDTCPDLAFVKFTSADWTNTEESLGSDHSILEIEVNLTPRKKFIKKTGPNRLGRFSENKAHNRSVSRRARTVGTRPVHRREKTHHTRYTIVRDARYRRPPPSHLGSQTWSSKTVEATEAKQEIENPHR